MRVDLITLSVVGISGRVSCWWYLLSIGYKLSQGGLSPGLLTILPLCFVWSSRWLEFPFNSHAANNLPKSLITKAKRELCIKNSKVEMQLKKSKINILFYF